MSGTTKVACPVCGAADWEYKKDDYNNISTFECPRCGQFRIGRLAEATLQRLHTSKPEWFGDALSHSVRQLSDRGGSAVLTVELLKILESVRLAPLIEQANNLILWVGGRSDDPATLWSMPPQEWASVIGGRSAGDAVEYLLRWSSAAGWIDSEYAPKHIGNTDFSVRLTFAGWQRYDDLQRQQVQSHVGFMAMQFNAPEITIAYEQCFKKAAEDAGFGLRILTEAQGAGLIDDQLRVAIRTAKFVIADVSTGNRGAYWEAGFAEGLGKPVIYTCREDVLNDKNHEHHPHFDTNHMNTVIWSSGHLATARRRLAATLRNTFPTEALMPTD